MSEGPGAKRQRATNGDHREPHMPRDFTGGKTRQGRPVRSKTPGICGICSYPYPTGEHVIYLPGGSGVHPACVYSDVQQRPSGTD